MFKALGCILFIFPVLVFANNPQIDSLTASLDTLGEDTNRVWTLVQLGKAYGQIEQGKAVSYYEEARHLSIHLGFRKGVYESDFKLGNLYREQKDTENALKYAFEAMNVAASMEDELRLGSAYTNIGNIYMYDRETNLAVEYHSKARRLYEKVESPDAIANSIHNIGTAYLIVEKYEKAYPYFNENLSRYEALDNTYGIAVTLNNLGRCNFYQKEYDLAEQNYLKSLEVKKSLGGPKVLISTQLCLAELYTELGKYEKARRYLDAVSRTADQLGMEALYVPIYEKSAHLAARENQFEEAYRLAILRNELKDSLNDERKQKEVDKYRASIAFKEKEIEIKELEAEKDLEEAYSQRQQLVIWLVGVALLGFVTLSISLVRSNMSRKKANQKLQQLNREKDGLLAMVAHDLKSPLNNTLGVIEAMKQDEGMQPMQLHMLQLAEKSCHKGVNLIGDLLELNKLEQQEKVEFELLDLGKFLLKTREGFLSVAEQKKIVIELKDEATVKRVFTVEDYLDRILDNLISNALKFSPSHTRVTLMLENDEKYAIISIGDQGPGFSDGDKKKMFQAFQKLSARPTAGENSTGLGLAIVKSLSQKLNAEVELDSTLGEGATFRIKLPLLVA